MEKEKKVDKPKKKEIPKKEKGKQSTQPKNQLQQPEEITEGKAKVKLSNLDKTFNAFYNPAQELNRDLSVLSIATYFTFTKYKKEKEIKRLPEYKFSICEPLSATGLRGMRYFTELPKSKLNLIVLNDMDAKAVECINQMWIHALERSTKCRSRLSSVQQHGLMPKHSTEFEILGTEYDLYHNKYHF